MTHEQIRSAFAEVYNGYYLKHNRKEHEPVRTEKEWEEIVKKGDEIIKKYNYNKLVQHMVLDLQEEFELQDMAKK